MIKIPNLDYNDYIDLIGTAHFTRRSIKEAYSAVKSFKPEDIALELDWERYTRLNSICTDCPKHGSCGGLCEFTVATDALGNVDANIWLIDMTQREMRHRFRSVMQSSGRPRMYLAMRRWQGEDLSRLWEIGSKEKVVEATERQMEALREVSPWIPRVLIDERNALMAARLAWIAGRSLGEETDPKILAFVGAAHVRGVRELLGHPILIKERFKQLGLSFSAPTLVRRIAVQEA